MSASIKRKAVITGYICTHLFYIFVSIALYVAYFTDNVVLYKVISVKLDENGKLLMNKIITGYIKSVKTSRCDFFNDTGSNCSTSKKGHLSEMEYVISTLVLLFSFYIPCVVGMTYILCRTTRRRKLIFKALLTCIIIIYILFLVAHVLYIQLAGKADGFTWKHLSPVFYFGFFNVSFTPFVSIVFILLAHKRGDNLIKTGGFIYAKYDFSNQDIPTNIDEVQNETELQSISMSVHTPSAMYHKESVKSCTGKIQEMVTHIWRPDMVGFGRDAKGLRHTSIYIIDTKPIGNDVTYHSYLKKKVDIEGCISKCGCNLTSPGEFPKTKSVLTETFVNKHSCLRNLLNRKVNEFYLFHGVPVQDLDSIEREGLDFEKYRYSTFGKGIYFSEDPVKADQYTGKNRESTSELCCILVCRVILGNFVIVKQNHTISTKTQSPPCKTCLKPEPDCKCKGSTKFDSVIYEGTIFREFIIYDTSYCFPEFAIMYERVS